MTTKYLKITPFDTVFFRGGTPFQKGKQTFSNSEFSLVPSNFYGAISSAIYVQNKNNKSIFGKVLRDQDGNYGTFHSKGVFLGKENWIYFPAPLDLSVNTNKQENNEENNAELSKFIQLPDNTITTYPKNISHYIKHTEENDSAEKYYIELSELYGYLNHSLNRLSLRYENEFVLSESKVGIEKDNNSGASKEEMLYHLNYFRTKEKVHFIVIYEGLDDQDITFHKRGFLKLGGRSKSAKYEEVEENYIRDFDDELRKNKATKGSTFLKLYFATPAIFHNGWVIDGFDKNTLIFENNNFKLHIIGAAVGKHKTISGWDMLNRSPKTGRYAVPAGSVYYIKLVKGNSDDVFDYFHFKNFGKRASEGFGLALVGGVNNASK